MLIVGCTAKKPSTHIDSDLLSLLPAEEILNGWTPSGSPQHAVAEDLFQLINGGAEIYYEYGFTETIFQSYTLNDSLYINLEIYQMEDSAAACGMFTFKTGTAGTPVEIGDGALLESYYLNFWKGRYLVTLIGLDESAATRGKLLSLARAVAAAIPRGAYPPPLMRLVRDYHGNPRRTTYIEGGLGLYNRYAFQTGDIFSMEEGVILDFTDTEQMFLFSYSEPRRANIVFTAAADTLRESGRFTVLSSFHTSLECRDRDGSFFLMIQAEQYIVISRAPSLVAARREVNGMIERLKRQEL